MTDSGARMATTRSTLQAALSANQWAGSGPAIDETKLLADALTFDGSNLPVGLNELRRHQPEQAARKG
jgi:hypothetical protein